MATYRASPINHSLSTSAIVKDFFESDNWLLADCLYGGEETIIRFRHEMPSEEQCLANPYMIVLRWRYIGKKNGMPTAKEYALMSSFEDALEVAIEAPSVAVQVASLTGGNRKTWRYFMASKDSFKSSLQAILDQFPADAVEILEFEDPTWEGLSEFDPLRECATTE